MSYSISALQATTGWWAPVIQWLENLWHPIKVNLIDNQRYQLIFKGLGNTLFISLCAVLLGLCLLYTSRCV